MPDRYDAMAERIGALNAADAFNFRQAVNCGRMDDLAAILREHAVLGESGRLREWIVAEKAVLAIEAKQYRDRMAALIRDNEGGAGDAEYYAEDRECQLNYCEKFLAKLDELGL